MLSATQRWRLSERLSAMWLFSFRSATRHVGTHVHAYFSNMHKQNDIVHTHTHALQTSTAGSMCAAAIHLCSIGLAVFMWRVDTPLYICLHLGNEGASVFLFVHQAKGISRPPPDSHCCNWVVAISTTVPAEAPGNSHTTKALFYSTFHMMSGAQM